ncbi:MAG: metallophosphoesterase [Anaerolineales bacterium]
MKILAISDEVVESLYSPVIKDKFGEVDLVLGCGDIPFYYLEFIVTILDVPLYYVPGNHDKLQQYLSDGRIIHKAEGCEPLDVRSVALPVMASALRRAGQMPDRQTPRLLLAGLGGSRRYNMEGQHQHTETDMLFRLLRLAPSLFANRLRYGRYLDILVTHAPPRGIHDADDLAHFGFEVFLRFMRFFKPRFLLHGHSHVYRGDTVTSSRFEATQVLNVYPYRLIEWEPNAGR